MLKCLVQSSLTRSWSQTFLEAGAMGKNMSERAAWRLRGYGCVGGCFPMEIRNATYELR